MKVRVFLKKRIKIFITQYYFSNVQFMTNLVKTINFVSQFTFKNRYINCVNKQNIKIITYAIKRIVFITNEKMSDNSNSK